MYGSKHQDIDYNDLVIRFLEGILATSNFLTAIIIVIKLEHAMKPHSHNSETRSNSSLQTPKPIGEH